MSAPYNIKRLLASPFGEAIRKAKVNVESIKAEVKSHEANLKKNTRRNLKNVAFKSKMTEYILAKKRLAAAEQLLKDAMIMGIKSLKILNARKAAANQQERVAEVLGRPLGPQATEEEMANALRAAEAAGAGTAAEAAGASGAENFSNLSSAFLLEETVPASTAVEEPQKHNKECKKGSSGYGCRCRRGNAGCSIMGGKSRRKASRRRLTRRRR